ncbi:MAG: biotin/lipoyl-binding protein [Sedimentibacter sp.]|uniref:efflux RND transporter periplasmic adaptor subunit n=1 Tax=Sedimentibacter sp. TaxID=1960295 RepID=UPI002981F8DF|nr:biotin/lipoyl-binding protein [Sedimentibacter sp.]MDW5298677.1 biotin/lipoyl-binding protein [Sedimentibacter sp.]
MKKNIKKISLFAAVIAVLLISYFLFSDKGNPIVEVSAFSANMGSISKTIEFSGVVKSSDMEEIMVKPNLEVSKTYVTENDKVEKGQLLAELDTTDLLISLKKSQISLEQLYSDLAEEESVSNSADKDILYNTLLRSKEALEKNKKDLELSAADLERSKILYEENVISKAEYDKYVTAKTNLESNLKISELTYNDAVTKYNDYGSSVKLNVEKINRQIESLNLDIESLNNKIEETKIYSTINGILTDFPLTEGRNTLSNSKIIIYDTASYEFVGNIAQEDAVLVKEGLNSDVTVNGITKSYEGVVSQVDKTAKIDEASGSKTPKVEVKIKIINADDFLKSGFEGDASVRIDKKENVLVIKREALKKDEENKQYLYVLKNGVASKTHVETGLSDDYYVSVLFGINENDLVILNPPMELTDGMRVKMLNGGE